MLVGLSLPHLNYHAVIEGLVSSFKDFVNAIIFQMFHIIKIGIFVQFLAMDKFCALIITSQFSSLQGKQILVVVDPVCQMQKYHHNPRLS